MFREESDGPSEDDLEGNEEMKTEGFYEHWGWVTTIDMVSGGNPLKWNEVTDLGVVEFLNIVSYMKDKRAMMEELNRG